MPTFGGPKRSSVTDDSIELSLNGTIDKFKSIEIVKQLHADGEIAQDDLIKNGDKQRHAISQEGRKSHASADQRNGSRDKDISYR